MRVFASRVALQLGCLTIAGQPGKYPKKPQTSADFAIWNNEQAITKLYVPFICADCPFSGTGTSCSSNAVVNNDNWVRFNSRARLRMTIALCH